MKYDRRKTKPKKPLIFSDRDLTLLLLSVGNYRYMYLSQNDDAEDEHSQDLYRLGMIIGNYLESDNESEYVS